MRGIGYSAVWFAWPRGQATSAGSGEAHYERGAIRYDRKSPHRFPAGTPKSFGWLGTGSASPLGETFAEPGDGCPEDPHPNPCMFPGPWKVQGES